MINFMLGNVQRGSKFFDENQNISLTFHVLQIFVRFGHLAEHFNELMRFSNAVTGDGMRLIDTKSG